MLWNRLCVALLLASAAAFTLPPSFVKKNGALFYASSGRDFYEILGVQRGADTNAIKSAYRRLAKKYHPDANPDTDTSERFKEINRAYEVLNDPKLMKKYGMFGKGVSVTCDARPGSKHEGFASEMYTSEAEARAGYNRENGYKSDETYRKVYSCEAPGEASRRASVGTRKRVYSSEAPGEDSRGGAGVRKKVYHSPTAYTGGDDAREKVHSSAEGVGVRKKVHHSPTAYTGGDYVREKVQSAAGAGVRKKVHHSPTAYTGGDDIREKVHSAEATRKAAKTAVPSGYTGFGVRAHSSKSSHRKVYTCEATQNEAGFRVYTMDTSSNETGVREKVHSAEVPPGGAGFREKVHTTRTAAPRGSAGFRSTERSSETPSESSRSDAGSRRKARMPCEATRNEAGFSVHLDDNPCQNGTSPQEKLREKLHSAREKLREKIHSAETPLDKAPPGGVGYREKVYSTTTKVPPGGASFQSKSNTPDIKKSMFQGGKFGGAPGAFVMEVLEIDFKTAVLGGEEKVQIRNMESCSKCKGDGVKPGSKASTCASCNGAGTTTQKLRMPFSEKLEEIRQICKVCRGEGQRTEEHCGTCKGKGISEKSKHINVTIPPGAEDGFKLKVPGGETGHNGRPAGDLYVAVKVKADEQFTRKGQDIYSEASVSYLDAILGSPIKTRVVDGDVAIKMPAGMQPGQKIRLRGKGVPTFGTPNVRGDHYITMNVELPKDLSREEEDLIIQLQELRTKKEKRLLEIETKREKELHDVNGQKEGNTKKKSQIEEKQDNNKAKSFLDKTKNLFGKDKS